LSDRNHPIQAVLLSTLPGVPDRSSFLPFDAIVHFLSNSFRLRDNLASRME